MKLFILSGRIFFLYFIQKDFPYLFNLNWNDIFCIRIRKDLLFHHPERFFCIFTERLFVWSFPESYFVAFYLERYLSLYLERVFFASLWEDISCILYGHKFSCISADRLFVSSDPERYFVAFCLERCFCILSGKTFVASIVASISRNTFCSIFSGKPCYFKKNCCIMCKDILLQFSFTWPCFFLCFILFSPGISWSVARTSKLQCARTR